MVVLTFLCVVLLSLSQLSAAELRRDDKVNGFIPVFYNFKRLPRLVIFSIKLNYFEPYLMTIKVIQNKNKKH